MSRTPSGDLNDELQHQRVCHALKATSHATAKLRDPFGGRNLELVLPKLAVPVSENTGLSWALLQSSWRMVFVS